MPTFAVDTASPGAEMSTEDIYASYLASTPKASDNTRSQRYSSATELYDAHDFLASEERDRVSSGVDWAGHQLKERFKEKMPKTHQRQKLSFDDVVGIMNA